MTPETQAQVVNFQNFNQPANVNQLANQIRQHITARKLTISIHGKNYPTVEAWQYTGALIGLFPRVVALENLSKDKVFKYRAQVEIIDSRNNEVISNAFAICSNQERTKRSFDEYAIASMAQTRAVGKAFRIVLSWILQASGYESTPAEEMTEFSDEANLSDEYKTVFLSALDLCQDAIQVATLCKAAKAFHKDPDVKEKATRLHEKFKNESNAK